MTPEQLSSLGFSPAPDTPKQRLICSIQGEEGTGKNHFTFTAPDPIAVQSTDVGTEGMVEKFVKQGKEIYIKNYDKPLTVGDLKDPALIEQTCSEAEAFMAQWESDFQALVQSCRTIVWDTATDLWAILRWARSGRMEKIPPLWYAQMNLEYSNMVQLAFKHETNLFMLHKVKDEYANNERTGGKIRAGNNEGGYLVQVEFTTQRGDDGFEFYIDKCRANDELQGELLPAMSFAELAMMVYPESDPDGWE